MQTAILLLCAIATSAGILGGLPLGLGYGAGYGATPLLNNFPATAIATNRNVINLRDVGARSDAINLDIAHSTMAAALNNLHAPLYPGIAAPFHASLYHGSALLGPGLLGPGFYNH